MAQLQVSWVLPYKSSPMDILTDQAGGGISSIKVLSFKVIHFVLKVTKIWQKINQHKDKDVAFLCPAWTATMKQKM